jgi:hypothetical protein
LAALTPTTALAELQEKMNAPLVAAKEFPPNRRFISVIIGVDLPKTATAIRPAFVRETSTVELLELAH